VRAQHLQTEGHVPQQTQRVKPLGKLLASWLGSHLLLLLLVDLPRQQQQQQNQQQQLLGSLQDPHAQSSRHCRVCTAPASTYGRGVGTSAHAQRAQAAAPAPPAAAAAAAAGRQTLYPLLLQQQ
jgi:hypothetical protein